MFLLDDNNELIDSEISIDLLDDVPCVIIESSGGANPARDISRRNPDYNKLVEVVLKRLAACNIHIIAVVLDSSRVSNIPIADRTIHLDQPYPIDPSLTDIVELRRAIGRAVSEMHRDPHAKKGGNHQKRVRLCLSRFVNCADLSPRNENNSNCFFDHAPSLNETEKDYIHKARLGQGKFRALLLEAFHNSCPLIGITIPDLLVASHIKPWAACTNHERLD
jgi:hypothetical protein